MACIQKMGEGIFCLDTAVVGWLGGGGKQDERMKLLLILLFPALPAMRMQSRGPEDWNIQPQVVKGPPTSERSFLTEGTCCRGWK